MDVLLDTSVILPLFRADVWTERARAHLAAGLEAIVSDFAEAEFASGIARDVCIGRLSGPGARDALAAFDAWLEADATSVTLSPADVALATGWLRRLDLNLRAPDALHLALASRLRLPLLTFDTGMAAAARALSLPLADA